MSLKNISIKDLHELYEVMGLSLDEVNSASGFTIHYLQQTFKELPFKSIIDLIISVFCSSKIHLANTPLMNEALM